MNSQRYAAFSWWLLQYFGFKHLRLYVAKDIWSGLADLHQNDVAHRDLKLDNVLVSKQHYSKDTLVLEKKTNNSQINRLWRRQIQSYSNFNVVTLNFNIMIYYFKPMEESYKEGYILCSEKWLYLLFQKRENYPLVW